MSTLLQNNFAFKKFDFSSQDDLMWEKLYTKQYSNLQDKACPLFLENLQKFNLPRNKVPNLEDISERLKKVSGWQVVPVSGLIKHDEYFHLLAEKKFPCAVFMRKEYEENLSKDPDLFHEVFGHCTMLLSVDYANFLQEFAKLALTVEVINQPLFGRLLWFTTETGLINTTLGLRIYGSSILSSYSESIYSLSDLRPQKKPFNLINIFREPYRADMLQMVYYIIEDTRQIYQLLSNKTNLYKGIEIARKLGEFSPLFPVEQNQYTNIGHCTSLEPLET